MNYDNGICQNKINTGAKWIQELIQELIQDCVCGQLKSVLRGDWGDLGRWHG